MTANNTTTNKNLTIIFASELHDLLENLAKQQKRSKGQMAGIIIEQALNTNNNQPAPLTVEHFQVANHG